MSEQARKLNTAEIDWGELLLEIQTDPGDGLTECHGVLYDALYGPLEVTAKNWLNKHSYTEARDGALVAIGLDKIFRDIAKFDIPDDDSDGIEKAFKAWALKCSEREWLKPKHLQLHKDVQLDSEKFNEIHPGRSPSPEALLIAQVPSSKPVSRSVTDRALMKRILAEELNKLPPPMKDALLESEDLKSVENPNARGKQGEAAIIAEKHGYKPNTVRTRRSRLLAKVKERFEKEASV